MHCIVAEQFIVYPNAKTDKRTLCVTDRQKQPTIWLMLTERQVVTRITVILGKLTLMPRTEKLTLLLPGSADDNSLLQRGG